MSDEIKVVSFGGGVQSTALLVLAARGEIDYRTFLFANVGDDSEHPDTLRYLAEVSKPYAEKHDIEIRELRRYRMRGERKGEERTLLGDLTDPNTRSIPIPVRMSSGAPGNRTCTSDWKINVIARELRKMGATKENPATVALGISVDEIERARPGVDARQPVQRRVYPLLDLGMTRAACNALIADEGLPQTPRSACWFCPFTSAESWRRMARERPDLFNQAVELEQTVNIRRVGLGRDHVYLTGSGRDLRDAVDTDQLALGLDGCDSGWCMT